MTENSDKTYERGATLHSACECCEHAAAEIERQAARIRKLERALKPFADIPSVPLFPEGGLEMAKYFWTVIGTPDRRHFTQTDLVRARAALLREGDSKPPQPLDEHALIP